MRMKKFLLSLITFCAAAAAMAQAFTPNPIVPPTTLTTTTMTLNVTSLDWGYSNDNDVQVGYDGSDVYIMGLAVDFPFSWMKGKLEGNDIVFPQGQFIDYFGEEGYSYEIYACGFPVGGNSTCDFVLHRDPETGIMTADSNMGLGEFMEYDGYLYTLERVVNIKLTPKEQEAGEATFIPAEAERMTYVLSAEDLRDGYKEYEAVLAFEGERAPGSGQAVYLGDFCQEALISGAAIKGYWSDDETIVFPSEQFMERYEEEGSEPCDFYFYGAAIDPETGHVTTGDLILDYDAATDTYHSRFTGILISLGKITSSEITFSEFLQDIVLQGEELNGIFAALSTSTNVPAIPYSLDGRRASRTQHQPRLLITPNARKVLMK